MKAMTSKHSRRPREGGDPVSSAVSYYKEKSLDSRLRGNDGHWGGWSMRAMTSKHFRRPRAGGDPASLAVSYRNEKSLDSRLRGDDGYLRVSP